MTLFPDLYLDFLFGPFSRADFCSPNICTFVCFLARFEEHHVSATPLHGAPRLWHLSSSRWAILLPLSGAASHYWIGMSGYCLARPESTAGCSGAAGSHQQPHAVAPHAGRSKGVRWPPEPQAPAAGRLLLLNDGGLFNTPFPGSVTRPRDEGMVLCNDLGTSPLFTEHRCAAVLLFPLWKGTSRSRTRPHLFFLSPSLSRRLFSIEKYIPVLRYSKCLPCFAGRDALLGPKLRTDRSGYWHVNQCADLAGNPSKLQAVSWVSGCRRFETLGYALHVNDGNHFKFIVASETVPGAGLA